MQETGQFETSQMLQRLIPSINVPRIPLGDDHMRPVTLRGLAPDHVLVLVNGKRRHRSAILQGAGPVLSGATPVDLSAIPSSAIDRIEVLRDGAAAQYGSDAIAGVVNIILKSGEARDARATVGRTQTSEGGRAFHDGSVVNPSATYGIRSSSGVNIVVSAELRDLGPTNRAYPDRRQQYFAGDPRNSNPPRISSVEGDGETRDISFLVNGSVPLRKTTEIYFLANGMSRDAQSASVAFRRARDDQTVRSLHPDGFQSMIGNVGADYSGITGLRGVTRDWRWDLSSILGGNVLRYDLSNSNNVTLGNSSPVDFYLGKVRNQQWTTNLDLSRSILLAGRLPLDVALGGELRHDYYYIRAGDSASYKDGGSPILDGDFAGRAAPVGAQGFIGFRPNDEVSAHRSNVAAYVDVESKFQKKLLLNVAGRVERYSDYGSTSDGKIAARFELLRGFSMRAAVGTGFRAPSLPQSYYSSTRSARQIVNGVSEVVVARSLPVGSKEARLLGATPLEPETSVNASAGVVIDMPRVPVVTIDYYAIDIDDRIVPTSELNDTSIARIFTENGQRGIVSARYFANAVDTHTRGIDVVSTYGLAVGRSGILRLTASLNATQTRVTRVAAAPPLIARFQSSLFDRTERGRMELGQPRRTFTSTVNYSVSKLGLNLHNQRFGQATLLDLRNPQIDQTVRAKWMTDAGISYRITPSLSVAANVANVFDVYPTEWNDFKNGVNATGLSLAGIYRYPGALSPFGMNGRSVFLQVSWKE
jgi:iron complex outermembrane receptor protein